MPASWVALPSDVNHAPKEGASCQDDLLRLHFALILEFYRCNIIGGFIDHKVLHTVLSYMHLASKTARFFALVISSIITLR
jgi:hypothetical protein